MSNKVISIVVPFYNESESVDVFVRALLSSIKNIPCQFILIFVDDGSTDTTFDSLMSWHKKHENILLLSFTRNFGHQTAIWAGIEYATGDAVIMLDSDLQHPPELISMMISMWENGAKVVQAVRKDLNGSGIKKLTSSLFYKFINLLSDIKICPAAADFRLLDKVVVKELKKFKEGDLFIRGIIPWLGFKTTYIPFVAPPRVAGSTKYSFSKMIRFAATGITSLSTLPLKVAILVGISTSLISFLIGLYAIYARVFFEKAVSGWASVMVGIFFIGGVSMFFLGVIGEYLGKVFLEVKRRPKYILKYGKKNVANYEK